MFITQEEAKRRIGCLLETTAHLRCENSTTSLNHVAVVMLPGAGRRAINHTLSFVHGMHQVRTSIVPAPNRKTPAKTEYRIETEATFAGRPIIEGTDYAIGENRYGLDLEEVVEVLSLGKPSLFSVSMKGAEVLKELFGNALTVVYVEVDFVEWRKRLARKYGQTAGAATLFLEREIFGKQELRIVKNPDFQEKVIDLIVSYKKPARVRSKKAQKHLKYKTRKRLVRKLSDMVNAGALCTSKPDEVAEMIYSNGVLHRIGNVA